MIKKYLEYIKESEVESPNKYNTISPYDDYFDEIQDAMKEILVEKGYSIEDADAMVTNDPYQREENNMSNPNEKPGLIVWYGKKIQKQVKDLFQKKTTPKDAAKFFIDVYLNKTIFNNQGNYIEPNKISGDRGTNSIDT